MSSPAADAPGPVASDSGRTWTVPGYTELRLLGGGGFGEVVLATHDATGSQVAIKYLHPDLLADPELAALFRAEAATLGALDSPYVVRLYEYVEGPAGAAIVMELVDGVTLAKILQEQGKTTALGALLVLYGSLLGLAAAHERGVVHRDYKPANVLVNGAGASKLTDFGIAALAGDRPIPTGTARYMPPEQFEGAEATPAADVYAATVTFYQCLTGRPPFSGQTTADLYDQHKHAQVPLDAVPMPLREIVARGMAKDPQWRPSDAGRLAAELRSAAARDFGGDWEERGRSHLAEAALLLALLWPSSGTAAVSSTTVEDLRANDPSRAGRHPQSQSHAGSQSQAQPQSHSGGQTHPGAQAHAAAASESHSQSARVSQAVRHRWHLFHVRHEEHLAHLRHLAYLRREGNTSEQPSKPRKRPRNRTRTIAAAATAVVVVVAAVVVYALTSHTTPPPAAAGTSGGGAAGQAGGGAGGGGTGGRVVTANEAAARIEVIPTGASIAGGGVVGPDGRVWMVAFNKVTSAPVLQAVNPTTYAVSTYPLPTSLGSTEVGYTGAAAFDGAGHLWLAVNTGAAGQQPTFSLLRYTPGTAAVEQFPEGSGCAAKNQSDLSTTSNPDQLFTASDGAIWVVCDTEGSDQGSSFFRISPAGAITDTHIVNNALTGSALWTDIEELPSAPLFGSLAAGPGGTMWGAGGVGSILELSAGGNETLTPYTSTEVGPGDLLGNGDVVEAYTSCAVSAQSQTAPACVAALSADGSTETPIADEPSIDTADTGATVPNPAMNRVGDVAAISYGTIGGKGAEGEYYFGVSPGGATKFFQFTVPGDAGTLQDTPTPTVMTPDGGLWLVDTAAGNNGGDLIEIVPKT